MTDGGPPRGPWSPADTVVAVSPAVTTLLAAIPSPDRGVWMLGPVPIRAYALCIIAGIIVAVLWGERRFVARGGEPGVVTDVAVWAVPFGLVGGRAYHVATDWPTYFGPGRDPIEALYIWQGGLGIWGAVMLGAVGAWIACRRRGVPLPFFADAVAPGIVVAQAIGRLGNWFNQELYGRTTDLPWGLEIYNRVDPATGVPDPTNFVIPYKSPAPPAGTHRYTLSLWKQSTGYVDVSDFNGYEYGNGFYERMYFDAQAFVSVNAFLDYPAVAAHYFNAAGPGANCTCPARIP